MNNRKSSISAKANLLLQLAAALPVPLINRLLRIFEHRMDLAERAGYHVFPKRFDSPIPHIEKLDRRKLTARRNIPGIDLRLESAVRLLPELTPHVAEFSQLVPDAAPPERDSFWLKNETFDDFDAAALHAIIRRFKPRRYVEVGCGFSSFVSAMALRKNIEEGHPAECTYIDPEPRSPFSESVLPGKILRKPVESVPVEFFQKLEADDILFIDTSHVLKVQSDVVFELVEVLPSLRPGVIIHIHDIFTPYDYLERFVFSPIRTSMNEQYALECLLSGGTRFEVLLPLYCLFREKSEELSRFFPRGAEEPHSFWIRKT